VKMMKKRINIFILILLSLAFSYAARPETIEENRGPELMDLPGMEQREASNKTVKIIGK
tara:strand:- start:6556 stop:6732 length:177 start_codon:yes stop_codon:yes gene_type:complete